jgi:hypothetical protein
MIGEGESKKVAGRSCNSASNAGHGARLATTCVTVSPAAGTAVGIDLSQACDKPIRAGDDPLCQI